MPKPTDTPTWATDATYSSGPELGEPTTIEPSAGFQAEGFKPSSYPRPEHLNWWMNLVYLWVNWITTFFTIDGSDNLTLPANLVLTGTSSVKHGDAILSISAVSASHSAGSSWSIDTSSPTPIFFRTTGATAGDDDSAYVSVPLRVGDRIKSLTYSAKTTGAGTASITVYTQDMLGAGVSLGTAAGVALTASFASYALDVTDTTLVDGDHIMVKLAGSDSGVCFANILITYDRP